MHYVNLNRLKKNWRLNGSFSKQSKMSIFLTETSFQFKEWYSQSLQQRFCTQNKTKRIEKIIFPYRNKIYVQQKIWNSSVISKVVLFALTSPPLFHSDHIPLSHSMALKNLRWSLELSIELRLVVSSYFHSASQSCPLLSANQCTFRHIWHLLLFRGDRSGMNKSLSATGLFIQWCCERGSPTWPRKNEEDDEEEAVKREIKESEIFVS